MVRVAVLLAIAAVVVAIGVFFVPVPFSEQVSWRASVGSTLTTGIALMLGAIALLVTARVESSDYKAQEETKTDLARLLASLASIQTKGAIWRTDPGMTIDFTREVACVEAFAASTTGFAMYNLVAKKSRDAAGQGEEWRVFFIYMAELVSKSGDPTLVLNRAIRVQELLLKLNKSDLTFIGKSVSNLTQGIAGFEQVLEDNVLLKATRSVFAKDQGGLDPAARTGLVMRKFQYLKDNGIDDPNIDMFLAIPANDTATLEAALKRGADPNVTDSALLRKYEKELSNFEG